MKGRAMAIRKQFLPIKVVLAQPRDYKPYNKASGGPEPLCNVTRQMRDRFAGQVDGVRAYFADAFKANPASPAVAKLTLKKRAIAKSHRPTFLFNDSTCPIIGGDKLGQLFIRVSPEGLARLARQIREDPRKTARANISTILKIEAYKTSDAITESIADIAKDAAKAKTKRPVRVRLFRYPDQATNDEIDRRFQAQAAARGFQDVKPLEYADGLRIYRVGDATAEDAPDIASLPAVQEVSLFPTYHIVRTAAQAFAQITDKDFPPPIKGVEYPLVGLIDTGTDPNNPHLQAWVAERYERVPQNLQNNCHGSFVAGLLVHARRLNNNDNGFAETPCRIIDVVALDRSGGITEDQLILLLDEVLARFPNVRVWNLSLAQATPCKDQQFSALAWALDSRSSRHNVLFVVPTGNFEDKPFRRWPIKMNLGEKDRICPPGDSALAITVGGIARTKTKQSLASQEAPSPFSRRGPGPGDLFKPEFVHYAGNCDAYGQFFDTGIVSIDGNGNLAEDIGVSFACPPVTALAATLHDSIESDPRHSSTLLTKALMVHAAFLRNGPLRANKIKYFGLGRPAELEDMLNCTLHSATIIMHATVGARPLDQFGKRKFPMPRCLSDAQGRMRGEVFMTLLYPPPFSPRSGIEHCLCNVEVSLGTREISKKTKKPVHRRRINPTPKSITKGLEVDLLKYGFKWSPIKLYRGRLKDALHDKDWRLMFNANVRSGIQPMHQDVVLIITIRDPEGRAPVYNELVRRMETHGWEAQDLKLRHRFRAQG